MAYLDDEGELKQRAHACDEIEDSDGQSDKKQGIPDKPDKSSI
jgi:hypothetical protein